ncbi:hypothetical protein GCM10023086_26760 [Streptomyces venetus]|uniref:Uncharacterized protein n=1 Tax=Streptomyces venetus TaxID=1701086 RepID=A0ABP8FNV9_9ACTN
MSATATGLHADHTLEDSKDPYAWNGLIALYPSAARDTNHNLAKPREPDATGCWAVLRKVGAAALGWRCFGASDHGPVSFRRVGQSVDLPGKARRLGP